MTRSGKEYLDGIRDGRRIFLDGEVVGDLTTHPGFSGVAQAIAALYDLADSPEHRELLTFPSPTSAGASSSSRRGSTWTKRA